MLLPRARFIWFLSLLCLYLFPDVAVAEWIPFSPTPTATPEASADATTTVTPQVVADDGATPTATPTAGPEEQVAVPLPEVPVPPPPAAPPPPPPGNDGVGKTVTIRVFGSTTTGMPCSWTSPLNERFFECNLKARIGYFDAQGNFKILEVSQQQSITKERFCGNGFTFNYSVPVNDAARITGVNGNAVVLPTVGYGMHGTLRFTYLGSGSSTTDTLNIEVERKGSLRVIPGVTALLGANDDTGITTPTVTFPPAPDAFPSCYMMMTSRQNTGDYMYLGAQYNPDLWLNQLTHREGYDYGTASDGAIMRIGYFFDYPGAVQACQQNGGTIPTLEQLMSEGSSGLPAGCIWTANLDRSGNRIVYNPASGPATADPASNPCYTVCRVVGCPAIPPISSTGSGAVLQSGQALRPGEQLTSPSGSFRVILQGDNNLVEYNKVGRALWNTGTNSAAPGQGILWMQGDCQLALYVNDVAVWSSGTYLKGQGCFAQVQDDGNFVVYDASNRPLWSSQSGLLVP